MSSVLVGMAVSSKNESSAVFQETKPTNVKEFLLEDKAKSSIFLLYRGQYVRHFFGEPPAAFFKSPGAGLRGSFSCPTRHQQELQICSNLVF